MKPILSLLLFACTLIASAQYTEQQTQYSFRQISLERGLPGQNVRQVYQDSRGIMWILVESVGLCRYDGRNFELFSNIQGDSTSLSNNYVTRIIEDNDFNFWVATENGLNKYLRSDNKFVRYATNKGLESDIILYLFIDKEETLWVGTGKGLFKYNNLLDKFENIALADNKDQLWVNSIMQHSSGSLFIGTNMGMYKYDANTEQVQHWSSSTKNIGFAHNNIKDIVEDKTGDLWVATHNGISKFDMNSQSFQLWSYGSEDQEDFENEGYNMAFTSNGVDIWFASYTSGIVIINSKTQHYQLITTEKNSEKTLTSDHILDIYRDKSGLLWIATKFEGIFVYDKRKELFNKIPAKYQVFENLKNSHIISFQKDSRKGIFWVGTKFNGLYKIDIQKQTYANHRHDIENNNSVGSNRIREIFCDSNDDLWVCLGDGLDRLTENDNTFTHYSKTLGDCIIEDLHKRLWVGTNKGVFIVNKSKKTIERYAGSKDAFFNNDALNIMYMYSDKLGQIWFGTRYNGLYKYNLDSNIVIHYSSKNPNQIFNIDGIRTINEDQEGNIWVGTKSEGICIFNPANDSIRHLTKNDGLGSDYILSIQQDFNGNFWIGTHNGLSKYINGEETITNYTTVHGLQGNIFEFGANAIFDDGNLIFGGHKGLNIFDPNQIENQYLHSNDSIILTSVKILNKEIFRDRFEDISLKLKHTQNFISIEFVLSDFVDPMNHSFQYRIAGLNEEWINLGNKNHITLSNLSPGQYLLEIDGTDEFGVSSKGTLRIDIKILPPLIQRWWFKALILFILTLLTFIYVRYKTNRNRKVRLNLEKEVFERTEKLLEANKELVSQKTLIERQKLKIEKNQDVLEQKVIERTKKLEEAMYKVEESNRLKTSFLTNMSHEIRTPLNAIIGFASIIMEDTKNESEYFLYNELITKSATRLTQIINDILDISELETGQVEINLTDIHLNDFLCSIYNFNNELVTKTHSDKVRFILKTPRTTPYEIILSSDLLRLKQIINNLIDNAVKFTSTGFIEFGYSIKDDIVKFYVCDTGAGIKQENKDKIFNHFVKLERKDKFYGGNGLGLSICKKLIELLEGEIWVDSTENKGSTFYFTLPYKSSTIE